MKSKKINSKSWHFDSIPVSKEESDKIREQMKNGIPSNMFVICGDRVFCGGDKRLRDEA